MLASMADAPPTAVVGTTTLLPDKKNDPQSESRLSWATWIRTALAVEPIHYKKAQGFARAINLYHIGSTNGK
jgi:hypothetical protein